MIDNVTGGVASGSFLHHCEWLSWSFLRTRQTNRYRGTSLDYFGNRARGRDLRHGSKNMAIRHFEHTRSILNARRLLKRLKCISTTTTIAMIHLPGRHTYNYIEKPSTVAPAHLPFHVPRLI